MGLLDFFRRRGRADEFASRGERAHGEPDRTDVSVGPPGFSAEGPPVGTSDPGALTGDDADDVARRPRE